MASTARLRKERGVRKAVRLSSIITHVQVLLELKLAEMVAVYE
jgi:hypothetical protein